MTSILDSLLATAAATGAADGAQQHALPIGFDGTRIAPTEGFVMPVAPATGKVLFGYQQAAVEAALTHRRLVVGFAPGMGKTLIAMCVIAARVAEGAKAIVVVPPSLIHSPWTGDFAAEFPNLRVHVVTGGKPAPIPADVDVAVVPDSITLTNRAEDLMAFGASVLVADEAHHFKNPKSKRSVSLRTIADAMPADATVLTMTGTLTFHSPADIYSPVRIAGKRCATALSRGESFTRFRDEWLESEWNGFGHVVTGYKAGLPEALTSTCVLAVDREAVLDLPERTTIVRDLVVSGKGATEYAKAAKDFLAYVREVLGEAAATRAARAEALRRIMGLWELAGVALVPAAVDYLTDLTDQGESVVVFAHHKAVLSAVYEALIKKGLRVGAIIGGMSAEAKAEVAEAHQRGEYDVLLGSIGAMGVGLTLHESNTAVFLQTPWAPGSFGQAQDRVRRVGTRHSHTFTHVLVGEGTIAERMWEILNSRITTMDALNSNGTTIDASIEDALLADYGL